MARCTADPQNLLRDKMRKLLLPPFLPLLAVLVVLLLFALFPGLVPGGADGKTRHWVMFVPFLMVWLYPVLLIANGFDSLIQRGRPGERFISVAFSGGALAAFACILAVKPSGPLACAATILSSYGAVAMMNVWRNRMIKTLDISARQSGQGADGKPSN